MSSEWDEFSSESEWGEGANNEFGDSFVDEDEYSDMDDDEEDIDIDIDRSYNSSHGKRSGQNGRLRRVEPEESINQKEDGVKVIKTGLKFAIIGISVFVLGIIAVTVATRVHNARAEKAKQAEIAAQEEAEIAAEEAIQQEAIEEEVAEKRQENSENTVAELATNERVELSQDEEETVVESTTTSPGTSTEASTAEEKWVVFTDAEGMEMQEEYTPLVFTIMHIEHRVKVVDYNQNIEVKTVLSGSLSGLGGTYELTVPYNIGKSLKTGNFFNVNVKLGTYNGKVVVDEIVY